LMLREAKHFSRSWTLLRNAMKPWSVTHNSRDIDGHWIIKDIFLLIHTFIWVGYCQIHGLDVYLPEYLT
jgi:hypothetical protein